jgi:hypothetical protein
MSYRTVDSLLCETRKQHEQFSQWARSVHHRAADPAVQLAAQRSAEDARIRAESIAESLSELDREHRDQWLQYEASADVADVLHRLPQGVPMEVEEFAAAAAEFWKALCDALSLMEREAGDTTVGSLLARLRRETEGIASHESWFHRPADS